MAENEGPERASGAGDVRDRRARDEAASWYARLNNERVSNADLTAFFDWRSDSLNDVAYSRIERLTTGARALADDPRLQMMAEEAASRARRPSMGVAVLAATMLVAGLGLVGGLALWPWGQTYQTEIGERRTVTLADGSRLDLNTDTKVRVQLERKRRRLSLDRGQALFAVAHDSSRPFVVTAGDTTIQALGTRFDVYRAPTGVRVTLAEGRVEVRRTTDKATAPVVLISGQQLAADATHLDSPLPVDVAIETGWTTGRLTFKDARLADAVAEVNRYSRRPVVLGDGVDRNIPVNGVFDAGDTDAFVAGVALLLDLHSAPIPGGGFELTAGQAPPA